MLLLSRDEVLKYLEVCLASLAIVAIVGFFVCQVLFFFFIFRREYVYAFAMAVLMVITIFGVIKLLQYVRTYREELQRPKPK
jgi:hypothetical protein